MNEIVNKYKQNVILEYRDKFNYEVLIETGTYLGDMVESQKNNFKKIISIELSENLYRRAIGRFHEDENIEIILGDSGKILPDLLSQIEESAIFWLDGHYSGGSTALGEKETPIMEELEAIFKYRDMKHVILIDDAKDFLGEGDYPEISELQKLLEDNNYKVEIINEIIRCEPL